MVGGHFFQFCQTKWFECILRGAFILKEYRYKEPINAKLVATIAMHIDLMKRRHQKQLGVGVNIYFVLLLKQ